MTKLTTHVLDVYSCKPCKGIKVELYFIENKERNVLRKKERTEAQLLQSRINTLSEGGETKYYERYLDLLLDDKLRTRAIKEQNQMFKDEQKRFDDYMHKEGLEGYQWKSKDV